MTKKDFEAIASAMLAARAEHCRPEERDQRARIQLGALDVAVSKLCDMLERDTPRFDRERFTEACRTGQGIRKSIKERGANG